MTEWYDNYSELPWVSFRSVKQRKVDEPQVRQILDPLYKISEIWVFAAQLVIVFSIKCKIRRLTMNTRILALIMGIVLVGCSAPAASPTLMPPTAPPKAPTATPTAAPTKSYVPLAGVMGIETSGGFLWAWNGDEIWRYTGGEWSPYAATPLYEDLLLDVAYLSDRLWAVADSKLQYLDGDEWQEIPGKYQDVYRVAADDQTGILWVSAGETVYRWNGEQMTDAGYKSGSRGFVGEIAVTGDGDVWAVSGDEDSDIEILIRYDNAKGAWEIVRSGRPEEDSLPVLLAPTPNGDLWIVVMVNFVRTNRFWVLAHRDGVRGEWFIFDERLPKGLPMVMAADDEAVWLAQGMGYIYQGGFDGLTRFDGENWSHYLPGTMVNDVAVAPDGSIWYTTELDDEMLLRQLR
jgi:hypothetical protein